MKYSSYLERKNKREWERERGKEGGEKRLVNISKLTSFSC